ncbi:MAG: TRAM domain-containing protein, partial [Thermoanaerobaculia bacterium]
GPSRASAGRANTAHPGESQGPADRRGAAEDRRPGGPRPRRPGGPPRADRPFRPGDRSRGPARPSPLPAPAPVAVALPAPPPVRIPFRARLEEVDVLELRVEKLVAGGDGLGRWEGAPIFIPRSAPGDLLKVRIVERRPDYGRAEIVEILEPGPARRPDPVPELSRSSICDLQHLDDRTQVLLKAGAVKETLEHIGKVAMPFDPELITGEPWHYRLRTQVHTTIDPLTGAVLAGYHARGTNEVIPVSRCPLLVPELEAFLAELPAHLTEQAPDAPKRLDLAAGDGGAITVSPVVPGLPHGEVSTRVGDFTYYYDARCFFQAHRGLLPKLVEATAGPWEGGTAVDLYSGVGLFSLPLSSRYQRVIAVEGDQIGSRFGRMNVKRNRVTNVESLNRAVESWVRDMPEQVDRVVVDPPRGGLSKDVRHALLLRRPERITYVSCHPAALARDLHELASAYRIEHLAFVDLFPQTGHMEVLVQLAAK